MQEENNIMSFDYISYRRTKKSGKYKLNRRTNRIIEAVEHFIKNDNLTILDIGTADGYMLNQFRSRLKTRRCIGIEPSMAYIKSSPPENENLLVQASGESLPFKEAIFDVITASSVLDHMKDILLFLEESKRVLKQNGLIIISLVHRFYDKVAVLFKLKEDDHTFCFTEAQLSELLLKNGFMLLETSRFGLPSFGFLFNEGTERLLARFGLHWVMFYILAVARVQK